MILIHGVSVSFIGRLATPSGFPADCTELSFVERRATPPLKVAAI